MAVTRPTLDDRIQKFVAEARYLRALHNLRVAQDDAEEKGVEMIVSPLPTFHQLSDQYEKLMREWLTEAPSTAKGALACLDLARAIVAEALLFRHREDGGIADEGQDLAYALEIMSNTWAYLTTKDVAEFIAEKAAAAGEARQ